MDTLLSIKVFVQVVEAGSFTVAAERLGISRAMVSKHIQQLEDRLGIRLLNRTTRRLSLTEAGTAYYERCGAVFEALDEADVAATQFASTPKGTLKVNAPVPFGTHHLYPAIADFLRTYPEVRLDLTLQDQMVDLVREGVDVALRIGQLEDSSLVARRLAPARLVVCGAPAYFERHGTPRTPDDLKRHNCLGYAYAESPEIWRFSGRDGEQAVQVSGNIRANNGEVLRAAAIDGLGLRTAAHLHRRRGPKGRAATGGAFQLHHRRVLALCPLPEPAPPPDQGADVRRLSHPALRARALLGRLAKRHRMTHWGRM